MPLFLSLRGVGNSEYGVGIYASDAEAYSTFSPIFDPIIRYYHPDFKKTDKHPPTDFGDLETLADLDPAGKYIRSTRVRCSRNLKGYAFSPCLTEPMFREIESIFKNVLQTFEGELKETYIKLEEMNEKDRQELIDDHFMFKEGDRPLQDTNACRFWPCGRGVYVNVEKTSVILVNYQDHLCLISFQHGGDLKAVYRRLVKAIEHIENKLQVSRDDRLGYLTVYPTNLGTTIHASIHIALPQLSKDEKLLHDIAAKFHVQVQGTSDCIYEIRNKPCMGMTEYETVNNLNKAVIEIIKAEMLKEDIENEIKRIMNKYGLLFLINFNELGTNAYRWDNYSRKNGISTVNLHMFEHVYSGSGLTKKEAKQNAAQEGLCNVLKQRCRDPSKQQSYRKYVRHLVKESFTKSALLLCTLFEFCRVKKDEKECLLIFDNKTYNSVGNERVNGKNDCIVNAVMYFLENNM